MQGMKNAGGMKMEMPEEPKGLELKRVTGADFHEYERRIRALDKNALDKSEGKYLSEREKEVRDLDDKYLEGGKHGELFVVQKGDLVVGFVALKKDVDTKTATIDQVRLRSDAGTRSVLEFTLKQLHDSLRHEGIVHATIKLDEDARSSVSRFHDESWFTKFYTIEHEESGEPEIPEPEIEGMEEEALG